MAVSARERVWIPEMGRDSDSIATMVAALCGALGVGGLLRSPVEKVPRAGIREILEATGRWPLGGYFTAVGLPDEVAASWPWNGAGRPTSLVERMGGMPEDDDMDYPIIAAQPVGHHHPRPRAPRRVGFQELAERTLEVVR